MVKMTTTALATTTTPRVEQRPRRPVSVFVIALLSSLLTISNAQSFDCSCAPSKYTFTFDFSLTCGDETISDNPGVLNYTCNDGGGDITPSLVKELYIAETNADTQEYEFTKEVKAPYENDDSFIYESAVNYPGPKIGALKFRMVGEDSSGTEIESTLDVFFTRDCSIYPVIDEGDFSGWLRITEAVPPSVESCSGVDPTAPTPNPTTAIPTQTPSAQIPSAVQAANVSATATPTLTVAFLLPCAALLLLFRVV